MFLFAEHRNRSDKTVFLLIAALFSILVPFDCWAANFERQFSHIQKRIYLCKIIMALAMCLLLAEVMVTSWNSNVIRQVIVTSNNVTSSDVTSLLLQVTSTCPMPIKILQITKKQYSKEQKQKYIKKKVIQKIGTSKYI